MPYLLPLNEKMDSPCDRVARPTGDGLEHNLFGKPVPTFPDHALGCLAQASVDDWTRIERTAIRDDMGYDL